MINRHDAFDLTIIERHPALTSIYVDDAPFIARRGDGSGLRDTFTLLRDAGGFATSDIDDDTAFPLMIPSHLRSLQFPTDCSGGLHIRGFHHAYVLHIHDNSRVMILHGLDPLHVPSLMDLRLQRIYKHITPLTLAHPRLPQHHYHDEYGYDDNKG